MKDIEKQGEGELDDLVSKLQREVKNVKQVQKQEIIESVVLCLDVSGSMSEHRKIGSLINATSAFIRKSMQNKMSEVRCIRFSSSADIVNIAEILHSPETVLYAYGNTAMHSGLEAAYNTMIEAVSMKRNEKKRVILMTDGYADNAEMVKAVINVKMIPARIVVDTVSFGPSDMDLLKWIAHATGGKFYAVEEFEKLIDTFLMLETKARWLLNG